MFRIQVFVLFICLFICLFCLFCLFFCLLVFIFIFIYFLIYFIPIPSHLFHFCSSVYIDFILSICIVLFLFIPIFDSEISKREEGNQTRPDQTTSTYVLNFPSFVCVCVYEEAQAEQKTLSSRPELLQKSGNVLVLCMQQQRLTVRRTGRRGMISRGLRTPKYTYLTLYSRIRIGKSMERVTTYF